MTPELSAAHEALLQLVYLCPVGIVNFSPDGTIDMINPIAVQLLAPLAGDEGLGNLLGWLRAHEPSVCGLIEQYRGEAGLVCQGVRIQPAVVPAGAAEVLTLTVMKIDDGRMSAVFGDATEAAQREREMERLATTDPLTGAYNRRFFTKRARAWMQTGEQFSVLMLDLDHFKSINDTHGHSGGDQVLCRLVEVLRSRLKDVDLVARMGGEEFAVLLPGVCRAVAMQVAERLRRAVEGMQVVSDGQPIRVTVSIGAAQWGEAAALDRLLQDADAALYEAKSGGRNQVRLAG